jgi:hypothetical protein
MCIRWLSAPKPATNSTIFYWIVICLGELYISVFVCQRPMPWRRLYMYFKKLQLHKHLRSILCSWSNVIRSVSTHQVELNEDDDLDDPRNKENPPSRREIFSLFQESNRLFLQHSSLIQSYNRRRLPRPGIGDHDESGVTFQHMWRGRGRHDQPKERGETLRKNCTQGHLYL